MTVKLLIEILQDLNKEAEVKLWWDSAPRGDVEAIYDTCDKKTVVLAGEWGWREHDIANNNGMDFVPKFTQDKSLPCCVIFVGWPGSRPPGQEWRDTPEGKPPNDRISDSRP
jgi:hypothetical protein